MRGRFAGIIVVWLLSARAAAAGPLLVSPTPNDDGYGVGGYAWTTMTADLNAAAGTPIPTAADLSDASALTDYDGLWVDVREPTTGTLSAAETAALSAYIATGRRVVLIGGNSAYASWNASILGLVGGADGGGLAAGTYPAVATVPLTVGVSGVYARAGDVAVGGATLFAQRVATVWGPARNVVVLLNPVMVGDDDVARASNTRFATNLAQWAAGRLADPTCVWQSAGAGEWRDGGSWVAGAMPAVADAVLFNTGGTETARVSAAVTARNVTVQSDRLTVSVPTSADGLTVGSGVTVNAAGVLTITGLGGVSAGSLTVNGTLTVAAGLTVPGTTTTAAGSALNVVAGGSLTTGTLSAAGPVAVTGRLVITAPSRLAGLGLTPSAGQLDVTTTAAVLAGGDLSAATAAAASGFDGGLWDGVGITSSAAAADPAHLSAVGVIANVGPEGSALYSSFAGQPAAAGDVLVRQTIYGDADLNGVVNAADYARIDAGLLGHLSGWGHGDFNYDGVVDGSDYTLIDTAFNTQQTGTPTAAVVAVPEPAGVAAVTVGAAWAARRRRGRRA